MTKKMAYLTDIHLDEEFPASVGVDTRKNWQVILEDISSRGIRDIIFGGDIGEEKANPWFFDQLKNYTVDLSLGNHDNFNTVKKYYTAHQNVRKSALYYRREFPFHTAIFLDSSTEIVQEEQLEWLQTAIQTSKPIIIFVHHPILPVNVIMDKRYALKGRERIRTALLAIPNKVTLFCGHYHLEDVQQDKNIHQYITPASSYQVTKSQDEINVNTDSFGYRILEFKEEELHTNLIMF